MINLSFPRPIVALLGGSPFGEKYEQMAALPEIADSLLLGGGLANTFLIARGGHIGQSEWDEAHLPFAKELLAKATQRNVQVLLPIDARTANERRPDLKPSLEGAMALFDDKRVLDIGPRTVTLFSNILRMAGTVIWTGSMGVYELPNFESGTREIARACTQTQARLILCGGTAELARRYAEFPNAIITADLTEAIQLLRQK